MARHLSVAEFEKTGEWARLSPRQRFWLQTYLASDDQKFATQCAYDTSGEKARIFSYQVRKHRAIQAALNRYFNLSPRDIRIQELQADIKASKPGSLARAKFKATLEQVLAGGKLPKRSKQGNRKQNKKGKKS